mmetsp:Transcript_101730/g.270631  ORF Transcript_101730/g.270631 Transcript_101730/m.270631 type:complete len:280 (-) Transcript_101730:86-925(-)
MGCAASNETTEISSTSTLALDEDHTDELVRNVSQATKPVRVSIRTVTQDEILDQRARARASAEDGALSRQHSGHVALQRSGNSQRSFKRIGSRISSMRPSARHALVTGIRDMHDSGKGHSQSLDGRLSTFGMRMKEMEADGNCQFRTLAFNLFGEQAHHAVTRKAAVAHMRKHSDFFSVLFESADEFKAYLRDMSRNRTWGDELTLRAVVEAYCCEAHVITSEGANWYLVYQPEASGRPDPKIAACPKGLPQPKPGKQVFLSYISPVHYNSVVIAKSKE